MSENEAIVFQAEREVGIEKRARPDPGRGEVLVRTRRSLISTGTELAGLVGDYRPGPFPWVPGYTNVGEVVALGGEVETFEVGDRVASWSNHQSYVTLDAEECVSIPDAVSDEEAAFAALGQVAMHGVRQGELTWGETTVVYGLGLVGQLTVRVAALAGAHTAVGVDLSADRLSYLPEASGVEGVHAGAGEAKAAIRDATGGRLADVVFEVTGRGSLIPEEFEALGDQGRFVVLSSPREETTFDFYADCHRPGHQIVGAHQRNHPPVETADSPWTHANHAELFFDAVASDRIDVAELITHRRSYEDAPAVYDMLLDDRTQAMGVVLEWW